ncbi:hypothetical protein [Actinomycetospora chiangmaiensis]|uniref:hypothetical protein n=1 Tax=Actinomycetospora chiangmaiensis TaxID=402650 RepID=UPI00037D4264|nr:hypothetical protein [Actinomycetospora chiangmaiensis]
MDVRLEFDPGRLTALWLLGSFVVVFLATRFVTRMIRAGRGPFRDASVGGVHVHHLVHGIVLMVLAGAGEFVYRPDGGWRVVLAVGFGAGMALALDEFALWLHLSDVYWSPEGRLSVEAVLVVGVLGLLVVLGADPFTADEPGDVAAFVVGVVLTVLFSVVAALKGKPGSAIIGVVLPVVAVVAAVRLARPRSVWARRRYREGSSKDVRARARFPEGRRTRWDALVDVLGGVPREPSGP